MEFKMLRFVVEDAVATITLDYAPTLNALDMNKSCGTDRRRSCVLRRRGYPLHESPL